ncbi:hypothetical protein D3C71_2245690 [compost metagenome]
MVDLTGAAYFELRLQCTQVGFAEKRDIVGFQGQLHRFPGTQLVAVDAGDQARRLGLQGVEQQAE